MSDVSLVKFFELVISHDPDESARNTAYRALTGLRVLQSGRTDPKHTALLESQLVEKATALAALFGMDSSTPMLDRVRAAIQR
jgi:hypothetical protein